MTTAKRDDRRREWVSYLRVSTAEQAERDLSLPAQRHAVEQYADRHGMKIAREYLEAGCSGTSAHRKAFKQMPEDVFRPGSTVGTVVVHHTSRFTRDATEARLVKQSLHKAGVRVLSVCQETSDDPIGKLIEGIFECIDQYESEVNGMRTSLAMQEAVRQGFFPSVWAPFGYRRVKLELRPGVFRWSLEPDEYEAEIVRELFRAYVSGSGAKSVAHSLNERGLLYRRGVRWSRKRVLHVLDEPAHAGTYYWGRWSTKRKTRNRESEWVTLPVKATVTPEVHALAAKLRKQREPKRTPGRAPAAPNLLAGLVRCGKCGASYQLETSGKNAGSEKYRYRYYNRSKFCRVGTTVCPGFRIRTNVLDDAILQYMAALVCTPARCAALRSRSRTPIDPSELEGAWRKLVCSGGSVSRSYVLHLIALIEVRENDIRIVAAGSA